MPAFQEARLKIEWANKHIGELERRIAALAERCTATIEVDPKTKGPYIKYDIADRKQFTDIALVVGDAAHNLRCALDYAWMETLKLAAPTAITASTKFPVRETSNGLEGALRGVHIDTLCPTLFDLVTLKIKPCMGDAGNFAIWPLHRINNTDKHRLLVPIIQYGSVDAIELEKESGEVHESKTGRKSLP